MLDPKSPEFGTAARAAIDAHEASEIVRRYQQGLGRPIISVEMNGYRLIAVGKTIKWSKTWRFFSDFLIDHLKDTIGRPWAIQAQREGKGHPIFAWLATMKQIANESRSPSSPVFQSSCKGHLGALWRLGYALYLIGHNDVVDQKVIRRLRNPRSFLATYHETQIAAAFAVSGFQIKMAEVGRSTQATPEFWASRGGSKRFAVEAKCKERWTSLPDPNNTDFRAELRQWVRDQLYKASKKKLEQAIYCFELSISENLTANQWTEISTLVRQNIQESEAITIFGTDPVPAYVIVTNNADVLQHQEFPLNRVAMLFAFRVPNWFDPGTEMDAELAFESHDAHRDVHTIFKCLEEIDEIPQTFDGSTKFLDDTGNELLIEVRIGSRIEYPGKDGEPRIGLVYDICSTGTEAYASVESEGDHHIVKVPLLPHEAAAAQRYGDAVFGKPEEKRKDLKGDPLLLYDWFLKVYEKYDRDAMLLQIKDHRQIDEFSTLPLNELRIRAAREVTKAAIATSGRTGKV